MLLITRLLLASTKSILNVCYEYFWVVITITLAQLGRKLKFFRTQKNISQEKFALLIGMDRTYYSGVESGKRNVSFNNLSKILQGLNVSFEEFFRGY